MRALFYCGRVLFFTAAASVAQSNKALAEAEKFYSVKAYDQALPNTSKPFRPERKAPPYNIKWAFVTRRPVT